MLVLLSGSLAFGDEVGDHVRFADEASADAKRVIDEYIESTGLDAPPAEDDPAETVAPCVTSPPIRSIDLAASGISSIIWCTGFSGDFSWVKLPGALNEAGQPIHEDGIGTVPGLYFAGLDFASTRKSGTIPAIAEEAARLVDHLAKKMSRPWEAWDADESAASLAGRERAVQSIDGPLAVIRSVRPSIVGLRILDIGCGTGNFARQLAAEGASVTGIDPGVDAIRAATAAARQASFLEGVAEALPFDDATFDIGAMINALHHVPEMAMQAALREARRVIRPDGVLIIIEPLPNGNFFSALRLIEDETIVRQAAQRAIETAILSGMLIRTTTLNYVRREVFRTVEEFLDRVVAVDPSRRDIVEKDKSALMAAILAAAHRNSEGSLVFDQPIKAYILGHG